jgi:hypothetical protein
MTDPAPPPHPARHQRPAHRTRDDHLAAPAAGSPRPGGGRPLYPVTALMTPSGQATCFFSERPRCVSPASLTASPSARIPVLTDPPPSTRPRTGEPAHDQHPARRPPRKV